MCSFRRSDSGTEAMEAINRDEQTIASVRLLCTGTLCVFLALTVLGGVSPASAQQPSEEEIEEMGAEEYKRKLKTGLLEDPDTTVRRRQVAPHQSLSLVQTGREANTGLRVPLDSTFSVVQFDGEGGVGEADPDDPKQRNDDDVTDSVDIGFNFSFYGNNHRHIFINNNGNITLGESQSEFDPVGFPSNDYKMVAPFWADVDTRNDSSGVVYRRVDSNQVIVTWNKVGYFDSKADKLNTFQVIISNGEGEDVPDGKNICFSYADMQWTTGDASGGTNGFGGSPATVGVNKGADSTFALVGRFDQSGDSYDGPGGDPDGVDYLDGRQVCFDASTESNNLPPTAQNLPTDPVSVPVGDSLSGSFNFLSPETGQITSVSVSGQPSNFEATTTSGNPATVEYSFTPSREQAGESFPVTFTATDDGQPSQSATVTLTFVPSEISFGGIQGIPERGNPLDVRLSFSDIDATEVQLFYRRVGKLDFQSKSLDRTDAGTYEGTLPEQVVTERGLEYYARVSDGTESFTIPNTNPTSQPLYTPVQINGLDAGVELEAGQYRMISVPLRLDTTDALSQLRDDFGRVDRTKWRLLRWDSEAGEYDEVTTENGEGDFIPGHAYWLITQSGETQDGQSTFDVGAGRSVTPEPIQIELPPGWTQLANPRPYAVAWSNVSGGESLMGPVAYDPSASDSTDFSVEVLGPWKGYWVYNPTSSTVQIGIPASEAREGQSNLRATAGPSEGNQSFFEAEPAYALRMTGRLERKGEPTLRDLHTVMGVDDTGQLGVGLEDVAEPPPIDDHLRISIMEEETRLAGSLRPPGKDGYTWDLEVAASGAEQGQGVVHGSLEVQGNLPSHFERRLMDRDTGQRIPITGDTFTIQLTDDRPVRHLRLIVGTEAFAEAESGSIRPNHTGLRAIYPNPSQGKVTVDYQLKTAQHVQVRIYDVLGRRVMTLVDTRRPAGHHSTLWNARSGAGSVASGAYFVRVKTASTSVSRRVVIVR